MKGNKTNSAKDMLVSMDSLTATLKEETKSTIKNILSEAVKDYMANEVIKEAEEDENEVEFDETEVETDTDDVDVEDDSDVEETDDDFDTTQDADEDEESEDEGDEWSEYDDYKVGDDEYDFTGENDSTVVAKVFKLLNDDDQVVVKQDGDKLNIVDNEAGTEYVIELNPDSDDEFEDEDMFEENTDMLGDLMTDSLNEEDLGYTDNYQSKDVFKGLSMSEPSKSGKSWSKGVPTGTSKPWAGKGKSDPFTKTAGKSETLYEIDMNGMIDEAAKTVSRQPARKMTKWSTSATAADNAPYNSKLVSTANGYVSKTNESFNKILKTAKEIQNENKELKSVLGKFKTALQEAVLVNVNLGNITKLMVENTTTQEEKRNIVERFSNEVKTVEQSKALYESIKRDFAKENKTVVLEKQMNVNGSSVINETKVYQSAEVKGILDLMNRMK